MARKPKSANVKAAYAADDSDDNTDQPVSAEHWINEIDAALKRDKSWHDKAKDVLKRYHDHRLSGFKDSKVNILWSNTEVLKGALYARTAKPDVRRRFPDAKKGNDASRFAAEAIERTLTYCADTYGVDAPLEAAVEDYLLPGRAVCRIEYDPEIEDEGTDSEYVGEQSLRIGYVYWEDFAHGLARKWEKVPWVGFRQALRKGEFKEKFPDAKAAPNVSDYEMKGASGERIDTTDSDKFTEVWEIWDKDSKTRIWVARGYVNILQTDPDPLELQGFFPCPKPMYSVVTNDLLSPEPEFCQYQDQANELDIVATRSRKLTQQLKWKGIYDGSIDGDNKLADLSGAEDGDFIPYDNWNRLKEKGGIEAAVGFWPMEKIIPVLQVLDARQKDLVQQIYEITGIPDVIRGVSDPNETRGAQVIKKQSAATRLRRRQMEVQRFVRDLYKLKGEVIATHFTSENLADITAFELPSRLEQQQARMRIQMLQAPPPPAPPPSPMLGAAGMPPNAGGSPPPVPTPSGAPPMQPGAMPPAPPQGAPPSAPQSGTPFTAGPPIPAGARPTLQQSPSNVPPELFEAANGPSWDDVMDILRSDKVRGYRIDIETDSTIMEDAEVEQAQRTEFMSAVNDMLEKAYLAATQAPMMLPLLKEVFLYGMRSFKAGRSLEQAAEDAFDALMENPPPPPEPKGKSGPDPAIEQAKLALRGQELQMDGQHKAGQLMLEGQRLQQDGQYKAMQAQTAAQDVAADAANEQTRTQNDAALKAQQLNQEMIAEYRRLVGEMQIEREKIGAMLAGKHLAAAAGPRIGQPIGQGLS
jgi:hypothetical protein